MGFVASAGRVASRGGRKVAQSAKTKKRVASPLDKRIAATLKRAEVDKKKRALAKVSKKPKGKLEKIDEAMGKAAGKAFDLGNKVHRKAKYANQRMIVKGAIRRTNAWEKGLSKVGKTLGGSKVSALDSIGETAAETAKEISDSRRATIRLYAKVRAARQKNRVAARILVAKHLLA